MRTLGSKIGKKSTSADRGSAEIATSIFNMTNAGDYTQCNYNGANAVFNTANYLQFRNQQPARALQATLGFRF